MAMFLETPRLGKGKEAEGKRGELGWLHELSTDGKQNLCRVLADHSVHNNTQQECRGGRGAAEEALTGDCKVVCAHDLQGWFPKTSRFGKNDAEGKSGELGWLRELSNDGMQNSVVL